MKQIAFITTVLITSNLTVHPQVALSQNASTYIPGYWQPVAQVANPKKTIILKILNKTETILAYNLVPETERFLEVGKSADVRVDLLSIPGGYSTVNIYSESQLTYEYSAEDNVVIVIVKPGSEGSDHKSVYISPTGRIYSF